MEWKTAWSYLPINYNTTIGTVEDITQRTYFNNNLNGSKIKIKFSNLYSQDKMILNKVVIGQKKPGNQQIEDLIDITFQGNKEITLGAGEEFYSDEIAWNIKAQTQIVVSIYIKEKTKIQSACSTWSAISWHTAYGMNGDYTKDQHFEEKESRQIYPFVEADANKSNIITGISEIKLLTDESVKTVALFGDSITHMSYYSDALIERVYAKFSGKITIINRGIGGNRILHDATYVSELPGHGSFFGKAAIKRFEEDVYSNECPESVFVLEGINDMMHPYLFEHMDEVVSVKDLQEGIKAMIQIAHNRGSKVYIGTVMPFRQDGQQWLDESEKVRLLFNEWIRKQTLSDGVIDFAKRMEQEDQSAYIKEGLHIGDGLHPNQEGGIAMAEIIPMEWIWEEEK
ncbi:GDSL-type esterase/lipase family protein [Lachnotalea glycerini]|uniref:SGNH hydrolase-type esterase domain-containing protein n=1 Tax=Lachnotalea glycerini TaxID=1763509 RepID=A0A371J9X6_9FIRM|nr:GDSL-type esterase/lipase family protein [Lachnotalea glycerini]RDY29580.1 hypothetical protein CG710_018080 [Lachnotalea glycerini]